MGGVGQIQLHRSNSMERLACALAEIMAASPLAPLEPEWVVVQGSAMQRWLSIQLSEALGVLGNVQFPFPRHLVSQAMISELGCESSGQEALQTGPLAWAIAQEFENNIDAVEFSEIRKYLGPSDDSKRFDLAGRVAALFDRYTVYRPEMLLAWEQGQERAQEKGWQPALWRHLSSRLGTQHTGAMLGAFLSSVSKGEGPMKGLPPRILLFGIAALPPLYMRAISALATRIETHLFVLSPSSQYWADIRKTSMANLEPGANPLGALGALEALDTLDEGNPLLTSLGRLSGDFQNVLEENSEYHESGDDLYEAARDSLVGTMLATVQDDILELRHRRPHGGNDASQTHGRSIPMGDTRCSSNANHHHTGVVAQQDSDPMQPAPLLMLEGDRSVDIHCCHSPMRELEVLHDELVARLEASPSLDARDIVVMMPNIEQYAPLIEAVFASAKEDRPRIPYRVSDRSETATLGALQSFTRLLASLAGRLPAPVILDLLDQSAIRARFGISEEDLSTVTKWIVESGIRWGQDQEHRELVGQPSFSENTWRFGLDRLLLGYAVQGGGSEMFAGVLAYDDMEGSETELLGNLLNFCEAIFDAREQILVDKTPEGWGLALRSLLGRCLYLDDDNAAEHQRIVDSLAAMEGQALLGGFTGTMPFESICKLLEASWEGGDSARGYLSSGITFCQMMPMRSIPFSVVCLLGMNDGAFPRASQPLSFDLIASEPKRGDRTARDDDRYLFLEAILAARDSLYISYVGRSIENNSHIPPSVLVGELLDVLDDSFTSFTAPAQETSSKATADSSTADSSSVPIRDLITTVHPLQPFSPRYFDGANPKLRSYSTAYCEGAQSLSEELCETKPFLTHALPAPSERSPVVTLDELARFFQLPVQWFLEKRLNVFLGGEDTQVEEREPIALVGLDSWKVANELLQGALAGADIKAEQELHRAAGRLPLGEVGDVWFEGLAAQISELCQRACDLGAGEALPDLPVDLSTKAARLTGTLSGMSPQGRIEVAYSRLGKRSEIGHWIRHLALCASTSEGQEMRTILVGRAEKGSAAEVISFSEVDNASEILGELLALYRAGQCVPLPFFPDTGRCFASASLGKNHGDALPERGSEAFDKALDKARSLFRDGVWKQEAESDNPYVSEVFGSSDCLAEGYQGVDDVPAGYASFAAICDLLMVPLLRHRHKGVL